MSLRIRLLAVGLALVGLACGSDPQESEETGELVVSVVSATTDVSLDGASVEVAGETRETTAGVATFPAVAAGTHRVSVSLAGYQSASAEVEVVASELREVTIALTPESGALTAPVVVRAYGANDGRVWLEWEPVPGAVAYRVYVATVPGVTPENGIAIDVPPPEPNHSPVYQHSCPAGSTCYFVVTAVNAAGESPPSLELQGRAVAGLGFGVTITSPAPPVGSQLVMSGDTVGLSVDVNSAVQVTSVQVGVAGRDFDLAGSGTTAWTGLLFLDGIPRGPLILTVTIRDAAGGVAIGSTRYFLDRPPLLTLVEPLAFTVARPQLHVRAICEDDGPSCAIDISLFEPYGPYVQSPANVPLDIFIAPTGSGTGTLRVTARDSVGSGDQVTRTILFETSTRLSEVAATPGRILDATADRILWADSSDAGNRVAIRDRVSGGDVVILESADAVSEQAALIPGGALFLTLDQLGHAQLHEWRGSPAVSLGPVNPAGLDVAGRFAAWGDRPTLFLRDVVGGTTDIVAGDFTGSGSAVAENGDVVYSTGGDIVRVRGSVATPITGDGPATVDEEPETDGSNIVFVRSTLVPGMGDEQRIILADGSGESVLSGPFSGERSYRTLGGWIAFTRPSSTVNQVWARDPDGDETQVSTTGTAARVEALSASGQVFFLTGDGRRHLAVPPFDTPSTEVSSGTGRGVFIDGEPFVIIGRSLFAPN